MAESVLDKIAEAPEKRIEVSLPCSHCHYTTSTVTVTTSSGGKIDGRFHLCDRCCALLAERLALTTR